MQDQEKTVSAPLDKPENDPLAEQWAKTIETARKRWAKFYKRVRHNRETVAGYNWTADADSADFYKLRANLIHGTITSMLPGIYARNPEISATPLYNADNLKLFCKTLETVTNRSLEQAGLKHKAKMTVRSALTCSYGIMKVLYQRDLATDPVIVSRMNDTQDNIAQVEALMAKLDDPEQRCKQEALLAQLKETMAGLQSQSEVVAAEGLVIDRVLTEHLIVPPHLVEFWDYKDAPWLCQVIPMSREDVEARYRVSTQGAKVYVNGQAQDQDTYGVSKDAKDSGTEQLAVLEIWDKQSQRVYTMVDGCKFWLREPYSPERTGARWYPYFLLPYQLVDGQFVGPSLVDLTEKLQQEHNEARNRFNKHRDLAIPGWVAAGDVSGKAVNNFAKSISVSGMGEITIVDTEGKPLTQVIQPRQHPPIDPNVYDTGMVRHDWEQVTGLQDAARSTVVKPKTATEASIMQQAQSGRVSEFRDQVEDVLQELAQYAAQVLLFELTPQQVERIMGPHQMQDVPNPLTGAVEQVVAEPAYDWPTLSREDIFDMVEMRIRAGTTGAPDKLEQQESWGKIAPTIQQLVLAILQIQGAGGDAEPMIALLRETIQRFDDKLDPEQFIPKPPQPALAAPAMAPAGLPPEIQAAMQQQAAPVV